MLRHYFHPRKILNKLLNIYLRLLNNKLKKILLITYYWENNGYVGKKRWVNFISG